MQQLTIVHKKPTLKNQKNEQAEEYESKRERGLELVLSRRMYRLENSDVFYIESSQNNIFHYCKINFTSGFRFCSCKDFEFRGKIRDCKHLNIMISIGIMKNKIVDVSALPKEVIRDNTMIAKSYRDYREDQYDF